ncbi:venom allergen 5-like [Schistocerca cancellata]|uniref:venom allergen 5-like n=1 Tax=Schistocerca cancellata TaxID=274614 RepID=UPI0021186677|nr:venom allergen 5-like [Schistocerca cancellata]
MVWGRTEAVGCGYTRMKYETDVIDTLVCNYGPGGNIEGEPVYIIGPALSACEDDTYFSVYYRGLCQKFYYRTTPHVITPIASLTALATYIGFFLFYLCLIYYLWLSQRYGKLKKLTTGTGKLLKVNEKDYVLADY